jgi:hypothetical protein
VKIIIPRMTLPTAGMAAAISFSMCFSIAFVSMVFIATDARAATWGHAQWCAVTDNGGGDIMWECVYDSVDECQPFILAGNRGFCSRNPYWPGSNESPALQR